MSIEYSCTHDLTFYQCLTQAVGKEVSILRLKNEGVEQGPVLLSSAHLEPYPICLHWSVFVLLGKILILVLVTMCLVNRIKDDMIESFGCAKH